MDYVLDLDLDFFVWPVSRGEREHSRLPDLECERLASEREVRGFLERRCGLSVHARIPGHEMREHVEAFETWREWLRVGKLSQPFGVTHVDGHADLGAGCNRSLAYLDELLGLPLANRVNPRFGERGLNSGNYLLGAIANRWVHSLTYVYPTAPVSLGRTPLEDRHIAELEKIRQSLGPELQDDDPLPLRDLPEVCFRDCDPRTREIQLKGYKTEEYMTREPVPFCVEPCVPFEPVTGPEFQFSGFTRMVVAHSPQYTPKRADRLLPVIRKYFTEA